MVIAAFYRKHLKLISKQVTQEEEKALTVVFTVSHRIIPMPPVFVVIVVSFYFYENRFFL